MPRVKPPEILYQDNHVLAVAKSAGMLSIPGRDPDEPNVLDHLRSRFGNIYTVHRLDRDTSGVLIFARNKDAQRHLSGLFATRNVDKLYIAIVRGNPQQSGVLEYPLFTMSNGLVRIDRRGKAALTHFEVLEEFRGFAVLEVRPRTGRQHQIRVHLGHAGYPLLVDPLYGSPEPIDISHIKQRNLRMREDGRQPRPLLSRTPLHALQLACIHPEGLEWQIRAPLPKDMRACIAQLRKWRGRQD